MERELKYIVIAGHYDVLQSHLLDDEKNSVAIMGAFIRYGPDDPILFEMFMNECIKLQDFMHLIAKFNKINIVRYLIAKGTFFDKRLWLQGIGYGHRPLAMILYELGAEIDDVCSHYWFTDFLASRESYRSQALLVLHAMGRNNRDVGKIIARVIWEKRGE